MPLMHFIDDGRDFSDESALETLRRMNKKLTPEQKKKNRERKKANQKRAMKLRHFGPGVHPGTGTDQSIHAPHSSGGGDSRTLYGGRITEMTPDERLELGHTDAWNTHGEKGELQYGLPRGKFPIEDPDNPDQMVWLEGKGAITEYLERQIRMEEFEQGHTMLSDGTYMAHDTSDDAGTIEVSQETTDFVERWIIRAALAGEKVTFTHNHPGSLVAGDVPLSGDDFAFMIQNRVAEMRAVSRNGYVSVMESFTPIANHRVGDTVIRFAMETEEFHLNDLGFYDEATKWSMGEGIKNALTGEPAPVITIDTLPTHITDLYGEALKRTWKDVADEFPTFGYHEELYDLSN